MWLSVIKGTSKLGRNVPKQRCNCTKISPIFHNANIGASRFKSLSSLYVSKRFAHTKEASEDWTTDVELVEHIEVQSEDKRLAAQNQMMYRAIKKKEYQEAVNIFIAIKDSDMQLSELSYKYPIWALIAMGHIEAALDVKNEALEKGIRSIYIYTSIIKYYCHKNELKEASKLYKEMTMYQIPIDSTVIAQYVAGFVKNKNYGRAESIFNKFRKAYPDKITISLYNAVFPAYMKQQKYKEAKEIYDEMIHRIPIFVLRYTPEASIAISGIFAWNNDFAGFCQFLDEIRDYGIIISAPHFLTPLRVFHQQKFKENYIELLNLLAHRSERMGYKVSLKHVYLLLLQYYSTIGDIEWMQLTLDYLHKIPRIKRELNTDYIKGTIATVYLKGGDLKTSAEMIRKIYHQSGDFALVLRFVKLFLDHALEIKNVKLARFLIKLFDDDKEKLLAMYKTSCRMRDFDEAEMLFRKLLKSGTGYQQAVFNHLIEAYLESKQFKDAERIYNLVEKKVPSPTTRSMNNLIRLTYETRGFEDFCEFVESIKTKLFYKTDSTTHKRVIEGFLKYKKDNDVLLYFLDVLEIPIYVPSAEVVGHVQSAVTKDTQDDVIEDINQILESYGLQLNRIT